jgi:hypothetical protein
MSGFSTEWLALREPADHRARNSGLRDQVMAAFAQRDYLSVVDLACGTGSNLRGLAPYLPSRQSWRLVDNDSDLLAAAEKALVAWADRLESRDPLILLKEGCRIAVSFARIDLSAALGSALDGGFDLVTAAAFFDLASPAFIETFCTELTKRKLPLYTILTYSGEEIWPPPHEADAAILRAFHLHQENDKGFGNAAGPRATSLLQKGFEARGYQVAMAQSPWRLTHLDRRLVEALADGIAAAAIETGLVRTPTAEDWRNVRFAAESCEIGHSDLFAHPGR